MVDVGESFDVDVVVSGLDAAGEIVSAFDLDVLYDASVLSATDVQFTGNLGIVDFDTITEVNFFSGVVDFLEINIFLTDAELAILQPGDSVTLATLSFSALTDGVSSLMFGPDPNTGNNVVGSLFSSLQLSAIEQAQVTVLAQIPEPGTFFLILGGLLLAGMKKRTQIKI